MKTTLIENQEEWRDIHGFEGYYQASSFGRIRSVDKIITRKDGKSYFRAGRVLIPFKGTTCNYLSIQFSVNNVPSKHLIHRLIAYTFLGLEPDSVLEVNHKDGNRLNNAVSNLELVTHQENVDHSVRTGLKHDYGECHVHAILTNAQAAEIREICGRGVKQKDVAKLFGVSKQCVNNVVNYKTYFK
jgi:hypothetical protein